MFTNIPAAVFKAECLKLMDEVARTGKPIVITKHGRPVAQLTAVPAEHESLFGYMKDTVTITGDVLGTGGEEWSVLSGSENHLFVAESAKPRARRRRSTK